MLAERSDVRLVVTQPDRPAGRGQRLQPTPVKVAAQELGLRVVEPGKLREVEPELRALGADTFVVASYGKILPQAILDLPRLGALNVHPSLLPLYRGATPLQSQIRDRCAQTGVTIIAMDAGMDTGDILLAESSPLGARETYGELHDRLAVRGAALLRCALERLESGNLSRTPQSGPGSVTKPLRPDDLRVDWNASAVEVDALIRSLSPQPGARAEIAGLRCKILAARPAQESEIARFRPVDARPPGVVWYGATATDDGLFVSCGEGAVAIGRVVPPNRGAMSGTALAASLFAASSEGAEN